jgi:hypothetical protein
MNASSLFAISAVSPGIDLKVYTFFHFHANIYARQGAEKHMR